MEYQGLYITGYYPIVNWIKTEALFAVTCLVSNGYHLSRVYKFDNANEATEFVNKLDNNEVERLSCWD